MIFPFVSEFFTPSKKIFDERFAKDYVDRRILYIGKRRIGYYQVAHKKTFLDVSGIFLSKSYQGKGIGKCLMEYFETLGHEVIQLQVWENNPAYHFYKSLGYEVVDTLSHKYLMQKNI